MDVVVGKTYRHFKGNYYKVICIANDSETPVGEEPRQLVVYESLYGNHKIWVRDYDMFCSKVDKERHPDVLQEYRFEKID